ncbi:MAG: DoxX family protein [Balneolaceae bacterium]|nr:MAG: DoxX family protein [Balneolaceae bacterium]
MQLKKLIQTDQAKTTILIRFLVGVVFLSEGIQKFLYPEFRGSGRFESIGIPFPEFTGYFVGGFEIVCGLLVLAGFLTRFAVIPLIIIMLTALFTTKLPILLGTGFWGFSLRELNHYGFLSMMHESRNDLAMLIGSIFLWFTGGGRWSLDYRMSQR